MFVRIVGCEGASGKDMAVATLQNFSWNVLWVLCVEFKKECMCL